MICCVLLLAAIGIGIAGFAMPAVTTADMVSGREGVALPIVMYHQISPKEKLWSKFIISDTQLENDLRYIQSKGYQTISMTQLINHATKGEPLPEKPIILTFDDGYESFYTYVVPLLEKYDMCAVVSIIGTTTDLFTNTVDHHLDYSHLNWEEVAQLTRHPRVEVQNHTFNLHRNDGARKGCRIKKGEDETAYRTMLTEDLSRLQMEITNRTGWTPNTFTYPFGSICPQARQVVKDMGFQAALTCQERTNVIRDGTDWLFSLGRYNREHGKNSEAFFAKILQD